MKKKLIMFTGPNCPSCGIVKKQIAEWEKENETEVQIETADISDQEVAKYASTLGIMSLPTLVYLENEIPIHSFAGNTAFSKLLENSIL